VHGALGYYHLFVHLDYDRALAEFEIARKAQPGASLVVLGMGLVKRRQGRFEDALSDLLVSVELDPRSPTLRTFLCDTYAWLRRPTQVNDCLDRILALDPARGDVFYGKAYYHLRLTGDLASARAMLQRAERLGLAGAPVAYRWVSVEMAARDYEAALRRLSASPGEAFSLQIWFVPKVLLEAQIRALLQDSLLSRRAYRAARAFIEQKLREDPEDSRYYSALGLALAGLGLKEEAIRAGRRATELLPVSKEAVRGPYRVEDLAHIYAMVGEADLAIDQLDYLMSIPADFGYGALKLDPAWDPLRSHPRFQRLLERAGK
jgi:tetratricopeptide (TPR) repeat protein